MDFRVLGNGTLHFTNQLPIPVELNDQVFGLSGEVLVRERPQIDQAKGATLYVNLEPCQN